MAGTRSAQRERTVVLVGGGHAHVQVLRRWAMEPPPDARLVVVLDQPVAVYSGMVPGFIAGSYAQGDLEIDVVPLARRAGAGVILSAAVDLDPERREIHFADRPPLRFDLASLDVGSSVRDRTLPGVGEHALSTRPIGRFVAEFDAHLATLQHPGSRVPDAGRVGPSATRRRSEVLVVGGGAAGCELALTLAARLRSGTGASDARIRLVLADTRPLAGASAALARSIARELRAQSIEVVASTRITSLERAGTGTIALIARTARGESIAADLVVWATGAAPVALAETLRARGLACDGEGFLAIRETLQTRDHDALFAVGDCARLDAHPWVPRAGVFAVRQGPVLERNLRRALAGRPLERYRPQRDFLALLNLGRDRALGGKWGFAFSGRAAMRLKDRIDRAFMRKFQLLPAADEGEALPSLAEATNDGMPCGGCAAKLEADSLARVLDRLPPPPPDDTVVVGVAERDDVAATRASDGRLVLHNVDAIRAFCDDPYLVGRVAAANAVSDLFAKGGRPRHAQALIGLPESADPQRREEILEQALSGLRAGLDPLGVALLGGHTLTGDALSIGLSITGDGPAEGALLAQSGARAGDALWLSKPLGTGVLLAADMRGLARGVWVAAVHGAMLKTNAAAGRLALAAGARAATDVTGFGLAGHLSSLLRDPALAVVLERAAIPLLPGAGALFQRGLRSTAHAANRAAFGPQIHGATELDQAWLFDPQTSGGLLFALPEAAGPALLAAFEAEGEPPPARIGRFIAADPGPGSGLERARPQIAIAP